MVRVLDWGGRRVQTDRPERIIVRKKRQIKGQARWRGGGTTNLACGCSEAWEAKWSGGDALRKKKVWN